MGWCLEETLLREGWAEGKDLAPAGGPVFVFLGGTRVVGVFVSLVLSPFPSPSPSLSPVALVSVFSGPYEHVRSPQGLHKTREHIINTSVAS